MKITKVVLRQVCANHKILRKEKRRGEKEREGEEMRGKKRNKRKEKKNMKESKEGREEGRNEANKNQARILWALKKISTVFYIHSFDLITLFLAYRN